MASVRSNLIKYKIPIICLILFSLTTTLRLPSLGYSDYHGDEFKAFISVEKGGTVGEFLLGQRKGPMQFIVSYIPYYFTHNYTNELAQRLPFAIASCLSVIMLFLFMHSVFQRVLPAFVSSILYITNGYITGFGRIAQYQNLNLLFSFSSLYFYSLLRDPYKPFYHKLKLSLPATFFWCLSILSHWDAVLIFPAVFMLTFKTFWRDKRLLLFNLILGLVILLPFAVPYLGGLKEDNRNRSYLLRRVGYDAGYSKIPLYRSLSELYNPYLVLPFIVVTATVSLIMIRKNYIFVVWFLAVFLLFELFVINPGTHIYNFILPLIILSGTGVWAIWDLNRYFRIPLIPVFLLIGGFMYTQTYTLFIDHNKEYPYDPKVINYLGHSFPVSAVDDIKPAYMRGSYIPLFGFPHSRFWNEINEYINSENLKNNERLKFVTNEDKAVCDRYMDTQYGVGRSFYAIGIKKPTNFVMTYNYPNYSSKILVKEMFMDKDVVVKIYRVSSGRDNVNK